MVHYEHKDFSLKDLRIYCSAIGITTTRRPEDTLETTLHVYRFLGGSNNCVRFSPSYFQSQTLTATVALSNRCQ